VMRILVLDSLFDSLDVEREAASPRGATVERWNGEADHLAQADIVAHVRSRIDATLIGSLRRCRVISRFGTGADTVDLDAARDAGIRVVTVRDYCLPELTSHTLALAFSLLRRLAVTAGALDRPWDEIATATPIARHGHATVVGFGAVGRRIASALLALGYQLSAVTRRGREEAHALDVEVVSLEQGLARGDLIFLHASLDETTRGLIDAPRLALMRDPAILINTARLGLIDEQAVADTLAAGRLGGLGLDARLEPTSPLRRWAHDPRVLITPHVGWYSRESAAMLRSRAITQALDAAANPSQEVRSR
jgi:D-3-phosphoglycerate dehydrogenase